MEAALRTAHWMITGEEMGRLEVTAVRGLDGVKAASVDVGGLAVGVAVASGLGNAAKLLDQLKAGRSDLHFVEVMTCPGGCIGGGGQPLGANRDALRARMQSLYQIDAKESVRVSHKNRSIQRLYEEYLIEPLGERSHHLLHTSYTRREALV
jgi:NADH-quinone oxidoreductase subunit G/NADP-reducing hydrogenase subunit HndD